MSDCAGGDQQPVERSDGTCEWAGSGSAVGLHMRARHKPTGHRIEKASTMFKLGSRNVRSGAAGEAENATGRAGPPEWWAGPLTAGALGSTCGRQS